MNDPIVEEIRQTRQKIMKECGNDLEKLLNRLKAAEAQDRDRLVFDKPGSDRRSQAFYEEP